MESKEKSIERYSELRQHYSHYASEIAKLLGNLVKAQNISVHTIEHREKDLKSFSEKISRPGKEYVDPLQEVHDLAGVRIILYSLLDVDRTTKVVDQEFEVDVENSEDKANGLAVDQFGYLSVHKVVRVGNGRQNHMEWALYRKMFCEIQIRTVLQHSWASISHKLQYKREDDIPLVFRRKLMRLAGLLELADEEFQAVEVGINSRNSALITDVRHKEIQIPLDLDSLYYFFNSSNMWILTYVDTIKSAHLVVSEGSSNSDLIAICREMGILSLNDLESMLVKLQPYSLEFFVKFEKEIDLKRLLGDLAHWLCVLFVGYDAGRIVKRTMLKWSDQYFNAAIHVGKTILIGIAE